MRGALHTRTDMAFVYGQHVGGAEDWHRTPNFMEDNLARREIWDFHINIIGELLCKAVHCSGGRLVQWRRDQICRAGWRVHSSYFFRHSSSSDSPNLLTNCWKLKNFSSPCTYGVFVWVMSLCWEDCLTSDVRHHMVVINVRLKTTLSSCEDIIYK